MAKITEYYNFIHDIPLLYCIIVAVLIPFLVIAVGSFINLIGEALGYGACACGGTGTN